jgi:SpoVK/Ycf46/Vps4 family AAA+-type ATPase
VSTNHPITLVEVPALRFVEAEADPTPLHDDEVRAALGDVPTGHRLSAEQLHLLSRLDGLEAAGAVRRLASGELDRLALRIRPRRRWEDLVLSAERMTQVREVVVRVRHRSKVYEDWGFRAVPSAGVLALFSGPSGTGKTMSAEIIAGELGLDVFKLDLSAVVSKYIGETEKNLDQIFDAAGTGNVVLFFDEADSLFGKRSEVKDARDRYANIEVSYLLQRLERYDGVVVLATNFEKNVDEAFLRRIHVRIEFVVPAIEERRSIWERNLPMTAPLGDVDLDFLSTRFEMSGGAIRNASVHAAFIAAAAGTPITMECAVRGVAREFRKLGRLLKVEQFEPWFELVSTTD